MKKKCTKCRINKALSEFPKNSRFQSGYNSRCKGCVNLYNKECRERNIDKYKLGAKERYWKNPELHREQKRKSAEKRQDKKSEYDIQYRKLNRLKIQSYKRAWDEKNRHNVDIKIKRNLRSRLNHCIKGTQKTDSTFILLGCTFDEFKNHMQMQFNDGMSWGNYGQYGWHIDHIIPCFKFDLTKAEEQVKCFHYKNLRPLWWRDNLTRRRKDK